MRFKHFTETELIPAAWINAAGDGVVHVFNPAILETAHGVIMAYRVVLPDGSHRIALCRLRPDWSVVEGSVCPISDLLAYADAGSADPALHVRPADPRLLMIHGRLYMHFNSGSVFKPNRIYLAEIDPHTLCPLGLAREVTRLGRRRLVEKNWMLFEHDDEVFMIYGMAPLTILRADMSDPERIVCHEAFEHGWDAWSYEEAYGQLRGGATPVRHNGRLFVVAHSMFPAEKDPARPRQEARCYVGAVLTLDDAPPFAPRAHTPHPVLELLPAERVRPYQPQLNPDCQEVMYPAGAVADGTGLVVSYGINDRYAGLRCLPWDDLDARLIPVVRHGPARAWPASIPPAEPARDAALRAFWWRTGHQSPRANARADGPARGRFVHGNFGDMFVPHLLRRLTGIQPAHTLAGPRMLSLGSVLHTAREDDVIWGTGLKGTEGAMTHAPRRLHVFATRGPITHDFLRRRGYDLGRVTAMFDPACLLAEVFAEEIAEMRRQIGNPPRDFILIPHFQDDALMRGLHPEHADRIVSADTPFFAMVARILGASLVVSSSLHGLIVAETLGVPAVWHRPLMGENELKFHDYYLGTDRYDIVRADDLRQALKASPMPLPSFDAAAMLATFPSFEQLDAFGLISRPEPLEPARMVRFNKALPGSVRLFGGWSTPEPHGVWSAGDLAELELFVGDQIDDGVVIELVLAGYVPDGDHPQRLTVADGVRDLGTHEVTDPRPVMLRIPLREVAIFDARVRLRFHIPTAVSPASLDRGGDGRRLGISLRAVRLRPAEPAISRDPDLRLRVGERIFRAASVTGDDYVFEVPSVDGPVVLLSRCSLPEDRPPPGLGLVRFDQRDLGVRVDRIVLTTEAGAVTIAAEDTRLDQGWWPAEQRGGRGWRWTNGAATIPAGRSGPARVEIKGVMPALYSPLGEAARTD